MGLSFRRFTPSAASASSRALACEQHAIDEYYDEKRDIKEWQVSGFVRSPRVAELSRSDISIIHVAVGMSRYLEVVGQIVTRVPAQLWLIFSIRYSFSLVISYTCNNAWVQKLSFPVSSATLVNCLFSISSPKHVWLLRTMSVDESGKVVNFDYNKRYLEVVGQIVTRVPAQLWLIFSIRYSFSLVISYTCNNAWVQKLSFPVSSATLVNCLFSISSPKHVWLLRTMSVDESGKVVNFDYNKRDGNAFVQAQLNRESTNQDPSNFSQMTKATDSYKRREARRIEEEETKQESEGQFELKGCGQNIELWASFIQGGSICKLATSSKRERKQEEKELSTASFCGLGALI
ncbi:hypothetical protein ZIOFF_057523 [Zingiber officinale]|uniref:Uncharacterized protein n=1 Tax=Zingiber officinale TaxID=94328 RepID=A0A8J5KII8_ZINOF|nr:hypothetical protein ZIOFF_057523 [Zingiber officinale]